jgi:hypothetical protein
MAEVELMRWLVFGAGMLALALAGGCSSTAPTEVGLGEEFQLAPNQRVRIVGTDLTIGFRRVVGDHRCPIDLACVVEGSAGVEVDIFGSNAPNPVTFQSNPAPGGPESPAGRDSWTDGIYLLRLLALEPAPAAERPIQPDAYRVRMIVDLILQ